MRFTMASAISTRQRGIVLIVFLELLVAIFVGQPAATKTTTAAKDGDFAQQPEVNDSIVVVGRHTNQLNRIPVGAAPPTTQQKRQSSQQNLAKSAKVATKAAATATRGLPPVRSRQGRFISAEDNGDEEAEGAGGDQVAIAPPADEQQQTEELPIRTTAHSVVPQEGLAQVKRVSRNVQRKMELLSGRVNQIQSLIAEDHGPSSQGVATNNYTDYANNQYSEQGGELTGDSLPSDSSQDNNNGANRQDASAVSSGPSVDILPSPQRTNSGEEWSAPLNGGDEQLDSQELSAGKSKQQVQSNERQQANDSTATGPHWTATPIIRSVIPARSMPTSSSLSAASASSLRSAGAPSQQAAEASDNSNAIESARKRTGEDQEADRGQQRPLLSSDGDGRKMNKTTSQSLQTTARPVSSGASQLEASMLGPEWSPNQNYQYFSELNAKNHGHGGAVPVGVAPPHATAASRQQVVGAGGQSRFQNMTIVNSDTDLVNSFSTQQQLQQEQQLSPPPTSTSATITTTGRPSGGGDSSGRKKSVYTYTGSNYGKSTKSKGRPSSNHLVTVPLVSTGDDQHHYNQDGHLSSDRDYEQNSARNGTSSTGSSNNNYLASAPIQWPAFAYSSAQQSNQVQQQQPPTSASMVNENIVGLPSTGNSFHNNRYSAVMQPASQQQQQQPLSAQESSQSQEIIRPKMYAAVSYYGDPTVASNQKGSDLKHRSSNTNSIDESSGNGLDYATSSQMNSNNNNEQQHVTSGSTGDSAHMGDALSQDYGRGNQGSFGEQTRNNYFTGGSGRNRYTQGQQQQLATNQQQGSKNFYSVSGADQLASADGNGYGGYGQQSAGDSDGGSADSAMVATEQASGRSGLNTQVQEANVNELTGNQNNYQTYAGQEALQQAAASQQYNNNSNIRQQQLSQMAAAIVSQNPSLANVDINSLVQRYQEQQQRLIANQYQQQQQLQNRQASESGGLFSGSSPYSSNSISRAYYEQQQQTADSLGNAVGSQNVNKRYSPADSISTYLLSQQRSAVANDGGQYAQASELVPFSMAASNQFTAQPTYAASPSPLDGRALRAVNLAYYRAALAAAAAANRQATEAFSTSPYMALSAPTSGSQFYATSGGTGSSGNNNYSSLLYANAAMNSPTFFEAPSQMLRQQQARASSAAASSGDSSGTSAASGSSSDSQSAAAANQRSPATQGSSPYRRSYLNSLFKPTASSRYYYTPTILSPISLASPTSLHPIYASSYGPAATAAAEAAAAATAIPTLHALPQSFAANPYILPATTAHHHQSLAAASQVEQAQQQYQAYAQAVAAAAAAAAALQPTAQYMADTEMAETSLVPSDNYGSSSDASSPLSSDNSSNDGGSSNGASNGNGASGSSTKSGKGSVTPWTNIAGLLLGILPFGILMASLLPAVTVAGRKKRQLELSGRNFSELLKWRAPSRVLDALIAQHQHQQLQSAGAIGSFSGLANGTLAALANEQLLANNGSNNNSNNTTSSSRQRSSFVMGKRSASSNGSNTNAGSSSSSSSTRLLDAIGDARNSLLETVSDNKQLAQSQVLDRSGASFSSSSNSNSNEFQQPTLASSFELLAPTTEISNSTSTTLSSPVPTTTPMSTPLPSRFVAPTYPDSTGTRVKSRVRKAVSTLNNFIVAAQNIKRKHRSSNVIESHWNLPSVLRNSLKLDNLFNMNEYKRQLANLANRKVLAMAQNQLLQLQQQRNKQPAQSQSQRGQEKLRASSADEKKSSGNSGSDGNEATKKKAGGFIVLAGDVKAIDSAQSVKSNQTAQQAVFDGVAMPSQAASPMNAVNSSSGDDQDNLSSGPKQQQQQVASPASAVTTTPRDLLVDQQKAPESWASVTTQRPPTPTQSAVAGIQTRTDSLMQHKDSILAGERVRTKHNFVNSSSTTVQANRSNPTKRGQLDICLRQFLCRLAEKLNKSLKSSLVSQVEANRARNSTLAPDNLEKLTKRYINQLIEQIETEHPSVKLSSNLTSTTNKGGPTAGQVRQTQQQQKTNDTSKRLINNMETINEEGAERDGSVDALYKSAMRNECSSKYNCVELLQLERTLAKMKLKFS